jgi:Cu(I)/Ag(I) efflux system protein CusF
MKTLALVLGMALVTGSGMAHAATHDHDMSQQQMSMPAAATTSSHKGVGVIKAVNEKAHKIQISHEPIAELEWPAMTMWFGLQNPVPMGMKVGDAVLFELEQSPSGKWVITRIEPKR